MFKIEYEHNGRTMTFDFIFHTLSAASFMARRIHNALHTDVYIYDIHTGVYMDYYWAD